MLFPSFLRFASLSVLALSAACGGTVAVPCFCFGRRYALAKGRPLPLLRFGCFIRRMRLSCAVPHAGEAPLSVMPLHGMTAPPRGEPSVPASITAKFMVRQIRKKVHLTTKFPSVHGRKLGSPCGRAGAKRLRWEAPPRAGARTATASSGRNREL